VQRTRNSEVAKPKTLRRIREDETNASRKQVSDQLRTKVDVARKVSNQSRDARQARFNAAHEEISAQNQQGRTAVINSDRKRRRDEEKPKKSAPFSDPPPPNKKQKTQTTPSERREKKLRQLMTPKFLGMSPAFQEITLKNNGIDNPQEAIKQMRVWAKEAAEKERLKAEEPPKTIVRQSVKDEWGVDLQNGDRVNIPLTKHREQQEMRWWEGKAKKIFNNTTDVDSVTIAKKGTLTREDAVNLGFIRDQNGGGRNGGGGRGMGG